MTLLEREAPLKTLESVLASATDGEGRVVLVGGEPGIGKTALVSAFAKNRTDRGRTLWGICDDLSIPRPFGPLRDLNDVSAELHRALAGESSTAAIQELVLTELSGPPRPTVMVFEDVHWADQATLDLITYLGRRIGSEPGVLVLTYREGEVTSTHPLRACLGSLPAASMVHVSLEPLSLDAVTELAGNDAEAIYTATRGNPFFVTEMVATGLGSVPPSVAHTVVARAGRLPETTRHLLELVSVVPARVEASLLDLMMPDWPEAAAEAEQHGLLAVDARHVAFRHELARHAINGRLAAGRKRQLSAQVLHALLEAGASPADIVHHAEAAGDTDTVASYAVQAARKARDVSANREAWSHFRRAREFVDRLSQDELGPILEEIAYGAYTVNRIHEAIETVGQAIEAYSQSGDSLGEGRCRRLLSRLLWFRGEGNLAHREGRLAVDLLEPHGDSPELAMAYSNLSQLGVNSWDVPMEISSPLEGSIYWGQKALAVAGRLGDNESWAQAPLVNLAIGRSNDDPDDVAALHEVLAKYQAVGANHETARAMLALAYTQMTWVRPHEAARVAARAAAYSDEYEVDQLRSYVNGLIAWLALQRGDWSEAERMARAEMTPDPTVPRLLASTVLAILGVRRGDDDARTRLVAAREFAERTGEMQRIVPLLGAEVELALLDGREPPISDIESYVARLEAADPKAIVRGGGQILGLAGLAGLRVEFAGDPAPPYKAMARQDWHTAAKEWDIAEWPFERALCLAMLYDEESLREALEVGRRLEAKPLIKHVTRKMKTLGIAVPRPQRRTTMTNPLGLTDRQVEVLQLIAAGKANFEIAETLFISPRTAEHHVAAILLKLGVTSRSGAAEKARELGLLD